MLRNDKQTTKLRVVYDGSAKTKIDPLSLNNCLTTGPNMIPRLFDVNSYQVSMAGSSSNGRHCLSDDSHCTPGQRCSLILVVQGHKLGE